MKNKFLTLAVAPLSGPAFIFGFMWECVTDGFGVGRGKASKTLDRLCGISCDTCHWNRPILVGAPCVKCNAFSEWVEPSPLKPAQEGNDR